MDLLCETKEPILASVPWKSPHNTSSTKEIMNALLRETLASLRSSVVAVLYRLQFTVGDCHLWLPRENGNDRIPEYLRPNGCTLDINTIMGDKARVATRKPWPTGICAKGSYIMLLRRRQMESPSLCSRLTSIYGKMNCEEKTDIRGKNGK